METQTTRKQKLSNGQLILVPHKDTLRLLEVYVKRSLSLNDGMLEVKKDAMKEKWVTTRHRRYSSDSSFQLADGQFFPSDQPETCPEEPEKETKKPKNKKPSLWRTIIGFFTQRRSEDNDDEQDGPVETRRVPSADRTPGAAVAHLPTTPVASQKKRTGRKSLRRRFSKRRLSLIKISKSGRELHPADIGEFEAVVSVEPTYSYYEKVTEELEKIVHEVKVQEEVQPLSDEEVINRIIALTKEQGDAIDDKLKDNPTLSSFFQGMTYSSFQKLADAYLEKEASPTHDPPTVLPTAPELVKLAFTLDFTARVASLSRQNIGHITGLGNRYLQDRFEYIQACTDHP